MFKVITSERAAKDIKKLDKTNRVRIYKEIEKLSDPFSLTSGKLKITFIESELETLES